MSAVCTCAVPASGSTNCELTEHRRHAWQLRLASAFERGDQAGMVVAHAELAKIVLPDEATR